MDEASKIIEAAARFAQESQGQPMQPQVVQPQPVPLSVQMASAQAPDGRKFIVLIIYSPTGQSVFHFEPEGAEAVAKGLIDTARLAKTGLEVPRLS